jgi:hypothetical protein
MDETQVPHWSGCQALLGADARFQGRVRCRFAGPAPAHGGPVSSASMRMVAVYAGTSTSRALMRTQACSLSSTARLHSRACCSYVEPEMPNSTTSPAPAPRPTRASRVRPSRRSLLPSVPRGSTLRFAARSCVSSPASPTGRGRAGPLTSRSARPRAVTTSPFCGGAGLVEQRDEGRRRLNRLRRPEFDHVYPGLLDIALNERASVPAPSNKPH